jgi:hypothetical protein
MNNISSKEMNHKSAYNITAKTAFHHVSQTTTELKSSGTALCIPVPMILSKYQIPRGTGEGPLCKELRKLN